MTVINYQVHFFQLGINDRYSVFFILKILFCILSSSFQLTFPSQNPQCTRSINKRSSISHLNVFILSFLMSSHFHRLSNPSSISSNTNSTSQNKFFSSFFSSNFTACCILFIIHNNSRASQDSVEKEHENNLGEKKISKRV